MAQRGTSCRWLALGVLGGLACQSTPVEPLEPTWADVAPILRGECNSCHGWTANQTGSNYRFDFFSLDQIQTYCGKAADIFTSPFSPDANPLPFFAGSTDVAHKIGQDIVKQSGAEWPRMPPQPSPALTNWEQGALTRWTENPALVLAPGNNHPPTLVVFGLPATANTKIDFTVVADDPDGDPVLGVIQGYGREGLINRSGSFDFSFDTSSWPAGAQPLTATLCDGWTSTTIPFGTVQIVH